MTHLIVILYYFCFLALTGLALFIYYKNTDARLNKLFALFALSALGWLLTLYFLNRQTDEQLLTLLGRMNFTFAAWGILFNYLYLPEITGKRARFTKWIILECVLLSIVTLFTGFIDHSEYIQAGQNVTSFGPLFSLYIAHVIAFTGAALYLTFYANRKSTRKVRNQLGIIGYGIFLMAVIAILTNVILPYFFKVFALQEIGALSIIALIGAIAYAISAHQLFDIRIVIRRTVVFTILFVFIVITYSASALFLRSALLGEKVSLSFNANLINILTICVIGFAIEPMRRWLTVKTDRFLFKREYDIQEVTTALTRELVEVINLDEALTLLMQTLVKVAHLHHAVVYVFQTGEHGEIVIKRIKQSGYTHPSRLMQDANSETIHYFIDYQKLLLKSTLDAELEKEAIILKNPRSAPQEIGLISTFTRNHALKQAVSEKLQELKAAVAIPLFVGKQPIGLIFLSEKKSGEPYNEDDLALLETVGSQTVNAIQKAKLYDDDQAKSEFVSIASHELLTPIAAIQGFLSMILEENMGKVDTQARGYLENVYSSSKRLRFLVKDLLSVSRIEAGTMKLSLQSLDVVKTINEAIDQLHFLADEKHLKLNFRKPYKPLPSVLADYDRFMEILINLIGNSIKYTPEGSVTVSAEEISGDLVRVDITDTGIGMSKEARTHLFEKFYRISAPETAGINGTGLGLFITKSIIEKMGGTISVKSKSGEGSTFSVTIPIFQVETAKSNSESK